MNIMKREVGNTKKLINETSRDKKLKSERKIHWIFLRFIKPESIHYQMVTAAMKLKDAYSLEGKLWPT